MTASDNRKKVALYARVSTGKQNTDNQATRLVDFAAARGYDNYELYVDVVSGANKNRPNLDRMTDAAKHGCFERVIATKLDRLGRSVRHLHDLFADMDRYNVAIEIIDQPIDTSTPMGRYVLTVLGGAAELERELISERTIDGLNYTRSKGTKLGRKVKTLSPYQIAKAKGILANNPGISNRQLASHFEGISRNTFIALVREAGLIQ
jgi:DNA invertase Pin-like site-specific DNA recombinase